MPEESTRKLLKRFGVAVTEFEDQTRTTVARLEAGSAPMPPSQALEIAEAWLHMSGEALARWQEVTHLLTETQATGQTALARVLTQLRRSSESHGPPPPGID